jgi:hypothetical protein
MKQLVTEFKALPINKLAKYPLTPYSKFDWVWRTLQGVQEITVPITVLPNALQLFFPIDSGSALQTVRLTYSLGTRGGKLPTRWSLVSQARAPFSLSEMLRIGLPLPVSDSESEPWTSVPMYQPARAGQAWGRLARSDRRRQE